jgi:lipoprotein-anchoring transpeptidase ErfK/SrfK
MVLKFVVIAIACVGLVACGPTQSSAPSSPVPTPTTTTTLAPTTTTLAPTTTTTGPDRSLRRGQRGEAVATVQARLRDLRYWVGSVDGVFGHLTQQAVFAFQKGQGLAVDGVVGPSTRARLAHPNPVAVQSSTGSVFEVDKGRQLLVLATDGTPVWIWNTSTGTERPYTYRGERRIADTPPGHFEIYREVDGWDSGPLGDLYRPKYFHTAGIAIHGYPSVPPTAASHGCVRVSIAAMNFIWRSGLAPIGTDVWVYE